MNNDQDVLLMENILSKVIGENIILENQDLISLIKSNIGDYGDMTSSGKTTLLGETCCHADRRKTRPHRTVTPQQQAQHSTP